MDPDSIDFASFFLRRPLQCESTIWSPTAPPGSEVTASKIPTTIGATTTRLHYKGYSYSLKKKGVNRDTYRCAHRFKYKCKGSLTCDKEQNQRQEALAHSHPRVHHTSSAVEEKVHSLKLQAMASQDPPARLVRDMLAKCTKQERLEMPKEATLQSYCRKIRSSSETKQVIWGTSIIRTINAIFFYHN